MDHDYDRLTPNLLNEDSLNIYHDKTESNGVMGSVDTFHYHHLPKLSVENSIGNSYGPPKLQSIYEQCADYNDALLTRTPSPLQIRRTPTPKAPQSPGLHSTVTYRCAVCSCMYLNELDYQHHLRTHSTAAPVYHCPVCSQRHIDSEEFNEHVDSHMHACDVCDKKFVATVSLDHHVRFAHDLGVPCHSCSLCFMTYSTAEDLNHHIDEHYASEAPIKCTKCDKTFVSNSSYEIHAKMHKLLECTKCGIKFDSVADLYAHNLDKHQERFECSICHKTFRQKNYKDKHEQSHGMQKQLTCKYCNKKLASLEYLEMHIHKFHLDGLLLNRTGTIKKEIKEEPRDEDDDEDNALNDTLTIAEDEDLQPLPIKSHLKVPKNLTGGYTPIRPITHKCSRCERCFTSLNRLRQHERTRHRMIVLDDMN